MPFWLVALLFVGGVAALAKSSKQTATDAAPPGDGAKLPPSAPPADVKADAPVYQLLTEGEKLALMKTLPTRFVTADKTDASSNTETLHLEKVGALGDAAALPVLLRANMIGGHAVLVSLDSATSGLEGGMLLLVPLDGGVWEKFAKKGSKWTLFLAPGEGRKIAESAGLDASALDQILKGTSGSSTPKLPGGIRQVAGSLPAPSSTPSDNMALGAAMNSMSTTEDSDKSSVTIMSLPDTDRKVKFSPYAIQEVPLHATMRDLYYGVTSGFYPAQSLASAKSNLAVGAKFLYDEGYTYAAEQALKASQ